MQSASSKARARARRGNAAPCPGLDILESRLFLSAAPVKAVLPPRHLKPISLPGPVSQIAGPVRVPPVTQAIDSVLSSPAVPIIPAVPASPAPLDAPAGSAPSVVGRAVYYGATPYFGDVAASNKSALLPTQISSSAHVTNYTGGINEISIDVANAATSYAPGDFTFRIGQTADPSTWIAAPTPTSVTVAPGAGNAGSARVFIRWTDGTIVNTWLQVRFPAANDTFYLGNLVGDTGDLRVDAGDEIAARANATTLLTPATIANPFDFNRDSKVDAIDQLVARSASGQVLPILTAPGSEPLPVSYDWHSQTINGALNIWAPNPGDFGSTFTVTDPAALFGPDGVPQIQGVHQGPTADCYFLSAGASLANANPSRIQSIVRNDPGGGWSVTFQYWNTPTFSYLPVTIHTSNQLSSSLQVVANEEVWSLVLEKAYAAFRTWNGLTSQNTMASLSWGYVGSALLALNDPYTSVSIGTMQEPVVYATIQTALNADQPVLFQTSNIAPTMIASHVYVITEVTTDTGGVRWVTTYNPWGFFETRSETELLSNAAGFLVIGTH